MPLRSMTGFGRFQQDGGGFVQIWEIRSVNGRFLDLKWRLPPQARTMEARFEKIVRRFASRGRVDIALNVQRTAQARASFDAAQAGSMLDALRSFASSRGDMFTVDYMSLLSVPPLWTSASEAEEEEGLFDRLSQGLEQALQDWNESRVTEAASLARDLEERFARMSEWVAFIEEQAPGIKAARFEQIRERLTDMLKNAGSELDESRFLQEVVILADKLDVTEELTRLRSHLLRLGALLADGTDAGRKLDFTLQECFREINTCGNKVQDVQVSRLVVECKNELEKCREQVQNLE
ncbi:YicC/YloC family endoribonuclease [uncultured Mailhella sp.]|uniref:YicC/YloC family endoribonuclease n=1 Tax=uncultured Mailhella sp. TaxID=1981031 RepID=UPI00262A7AC9|nr:YicC/YloC family endoribonuclease [uncultured Mailhella sp.]